MSRKLRIAIYMRLSKGDYAVRNRLLSQDEICCEESNSIRMQRKLLKEFVENYFKDYELLEFEDDGYSGTSFNRPGVSRLLEMVRNMEVDCIIVKDFSRFSRDYIELGAYLEQIFPFMGVRFISVNDGYDSAAKRYVAGELDISFKNLLYDLYSKDLSVKVKSALAVRKERGQYISANSPFGYVKSVEDRHMLLIAEDEAAVVRRIFTLALQGCSSGDIARIFNREGVKTPMQFRMEKGETGRTPKKGIFIWQSSMVCQILHNQVYVGDLVYGKTEKETVGGRNRLKPRSEWKIYAGHHAPIIDRQTFQMLQEGRTTQNEFGQGGQLPMEKQALPMKKQASRLPTGKQALNSPIRKQAFNSQIGQQAQHPLTGRLVCGCCGRNLSLRKMAVPYFVCPYRYVNSLERCVEKVDALDLECHVLSEMQAHILQMEGEKNLMAKCQEIAEKKQEEWKKRRHKLQKEKISLKKRRVEMYETYSAAGKDLIASQAMMGNLVGKKDFAGEKDIANEKDFVSEKNLASEKNFADRKSILKARLAEAEKQEATIRVDAARAEEKIAYWSQIMDREPQKAGIMSCLGMTELTRQNVAELIDKIIVYGDAHSKIKIFWKKWERVELFQHLRDTGGN